MYIYFRAINPFKDEHVYLMSEQPNFFNKTNGGSGNFGFDTCFST